MKQAPGTTERSPAAHHPTDDHPTDEPHSGREQAEQAAARRTFMITILADVILPVGLYYVLRAMGYSELVSLLLSGSPPALYTLYSIIRHRRVDTVGVFVLVLIVLGALGSLVSGSPRALLVRGGLFTGAISLWILSTGLTARPFTYRALQALLPGKRSALERLWNTEPVFRRVWRGLNVLWGCGLLLDAVLRVVMAYALPVDTVPLLDGVLYAVTYVVLQVITHVVLHRTGTFRMIFAKPPAEPSGSPESARSAEPSRPPRPAASPDSGTGRPQDGGTVP